MWYSNSLAQWFDIPITATPTHDEKGTAAKSLQGQRGWARVQSSSSGLWWGGHPQTRKAFFSLCVKLNSYSQSEWAEATSPLLPLNQH